MKIGNPAFVTDQGTDQVSLARAFEEQNRFNCVAGLTHSGKPGVGQVPGGDLPSICCRAPDRFVTLGQSVIPVWNFSTPPKRSGKQCHPERRLRSPDHAR